MAATGVRACAPTSAVPSSDGSEEALIPVHYCCSPKHYRLIVSVRQRAEEDVPMQGKLPNVLSVRALRQIIMLVGITCVPKWTTNARETLTCVIFISRKLRVATFILLFHKL